MNVFYEEDGQFKVGAIMSSTDSSLQIEAPHGKRSKIKSSAVLLRFSAPLADFLATADTLSIELDTDFLWECCNTDEFSFEDLAREYYGHAPTPQEAAAVALRLHAAPMYFYRKGRGRYKAAPQEALHAALASAAKKKQQQAQIDAWVSEIKAGQLPATWQGQLMTLLHRPDKNTLEYKALEQACHVLASSPLKVIAERGGIPSVPDYLLAGFLLENFPKGRGFTSYPPVSLADELPLAQVAAFSIDDAATTEIDDAFSLHKLANGNWQVGIHIAAPSLGIPPDHPLEQVILSRLSTVYFPGDKITMLPDDVVEHFTLRAGQACPALSLYAEVTPDYQLLSHESRLERVEIAANLRHDSLEPLFNEETLACDPGIDYPYKAELRTLWAFACALETRRGKADNSGTPRLDYNFSVTDGHVTITPRKRGSPMDKLVSELMILVNCEWGGTLDRAGIPGIYRAQSSGKVKMTTTAQPHAGLGVAQYAWSSSPLRRAVDFVNQRQLIAMLREEPPQYPQGSPHLFAVLRDFDAAYSAYNDFQNRMERFWCLRWLQQENITEISANSIKEDLVRINGLPLVTRITGLPEQVAGAQLRLHIVRIDELTQEIEFKYLETVATA